MKGKQMATLGRILIGLSPDIQPQTVSVYTRHSANCNKREDRDCKSCDCPKALYIFQDGKDFRVSARTRSWKEAEKLKREIEDSLDPLKLQLRKLQQEQELTRVTMSSAVELYLLDARARNLASATLRKRKCIFRKQLLPWTEQKGIFFLDQLTTSQLTQWRATWTLAPITKQNQQEIVGGFFRFCIGQGWLKANPALQLTRIQVTPRPTDYFPRDEFQKLAEATYLFGQSSRNPNITSSIRMRTLLLLMRWSGLRIGDAVRLERSRLVGNSILLYQAKTGISVYVPLPASVAEHLRSVPPGLKPNPRYFFWSGEGKRDSAVTIWERAFQRLFEIADIRNADGTPKRCHVQMVRDTFAVEHLLAGVPIDQVSMLLGHKSVKTTEKHYAPWVKARQEQLQNSVTRSNLLQRACESTA
jgi:integrase